MIDYHAPDYSRILAERQSRLIMLRSDATLLNAAKVHYRTHPWDFISDWGTTFDPRNVERGLIPHIPFVLWPKQVEYVEWMYRLWRSSERGLCEKSRDCGVTWLSVGFAVSMWLFEPGFTIGFGSRKEELIDKLGDEKSIFEKLRIFIDNLPDELLPIQWNKRTCSARMRLLNPETGSAIIGEAGDQIGRGGRSSLYLVDEAAFIERQNIVDSALSSNTNCQIDISTVNGAGNEFYRKRMRLEGTDRLFVFDWRDDPRKDQAWYDKKKAELDPVIVAQEIDRDYNASTEDAFIPGQWVAAAIDAHKRLGILPEGIRVTAFDPADVGDSKAVVCRHGSIICEAMQRADGDITQAIPWAFEIADRFRADVLRYDGDGMGAPTMKLSLANKSAGRMQVTAYHGSGQVESPNKTYGAKDSDSRLNKDVFVNYRAQTWTWARERFKATFDAIERANNGLLVNIDPEDLISIDSDCEELRQLQSELSRPKRIFSNNGKIRVESKPDMKRRGIDSPNLADALVMALATKRAVQQKPILVSRRDYLDAGTGY